MAATTPEPTSNDNLPWRVYSLTGELFGALSDSLSAYLLQSSLLYGFGLDTVVAGPGDTFDAARSAFVPVARI
jgi:hypothetical protein